MNSTANGIILAAVGVLFLHLAFSGKGKRVWQAITTDDPFAEPGAGKTPTDKSKGPAKDEKDDDDKGGAGPAFDPWAHVRG